MSRRLFHYGPITTGPRREGGGGGGGTVPGQFTADAILRATAYEDGSSDPTPVNVFVRDDFGRSGAGFGTADVGGAWSTDGTATLSTDGSEGDIDASESVFAYSAVGSVVNDREIKFRVKGPLKANSRTVRLILRQISGTNEAQTGYAVYCSFANLAGGNNSIVVYRESDPISEPILSRSHGASEDNGYVWFKVAISGTNPTVIRVKTWRDSEFEPAGWQGEVSDSSAPQQGAGVQQAFEIGFTGPISIDSVLVAESIPALVRTQFTADAIVRVGRSGSFTANARIAKPTKTKIDNDQSRGTWTNELGGTTDIFTSIDEDVADDGDYIVTSSNPSNTTYVGDLTTAEDPQRSDDHFIRVRHLKDGPRSCDLVVALLQSGVVIREFTVNPDTATTTEVELSGAEADAITDYSALEVRFVASTTSGGGPTTVRVTWFEFEVPGSVTEVTPSFTANAVIRRTQPGSLTADAIIRRTTAASVTADAVLRATISAALTADAVLFATIAASLTANAVVRRLNQPGSFTIDATVALVRTDQFTADAVLRATIPASIPIDAVIRATAAASLTADSVIRKTQTATLTADAVVLRTVAAGLTADGVIRATITGSFTGNAVFLRNMAATFLVDAVLSILHTEQLTADAVLLRTQAHTFVADAVVRRTASATVTADAVLRAAFTAGFTADAVTLKTVAASLSTDAVLLATRMAGFVADAVLLSPRTLSLTGDAVIRANRTSVLTADATVQRPQSATLVADAVVRATYGSGISVNAFIVAAGSGAGAFTADAVLRSIATQALTVDAVLRVAAAGSFVADAYLRAQRLAAFTADAIVFRTAAAALTADAIVRVGRSGSITLDAQLRLGGAGSFLADAVLRASRSNLVLADAVLRATRPETITTDAVVRRTSALTFTADAWIVGGFFTFTVDALIRRAQLASFTFDAVIGVNDYTPINSAVSSELISASVSGGPGASVLARETLSATVGAAHLSATVEGSDE